MPCGLKILMRFQAYDIPVSQSKISTNEDSQPGPERNLGNGDWIPKRVGKFSMSIKPLRGTGHFQALTLCTNTLTG